MEVFKKICNVFGIVFAVIFSIVLLVVLLAIPIVSSVSSFFQTETLHTVMKEIDYEEVILSDEEISATLEGNGLDVETIEAIVASNAVGETVDLYIEDVFAAMEGDVRGKKLTAEAIKEIAYDHMDEIVEIAKDYKDPADSITDREIEAQIKAVVEAHAQEVVELFPEPESLGLENTESFAVQTVKNVGKGILVWLLIGVAFFFSALIILCRIKHLKGFLWVGIVFFLAAVLVFVAFGAIGSLNLSNILQVEGWMQSLTDSVISIFSGKLMIGGILLFVFGILFTAVFVVRKIFFSKKKEL